jgi:hypothetical protein
MDFLDVFLHFCVHEGCGHSHSSDEATSVIARRRRFVDAEDIGGDGGEVAVGSDLNVGGGDGVIGAVRSLGKGAAICCIGASGEG